MSECVSFTAKLLKHQYLYVEMRVRIHNFSLLYRLCVCVSFATKLLEQAKKIHNLMVKGSITGSCV